MAVENLKKEIEYPKKGILSKDIFEDATLFCMSSGSEISSHTSTKKGHVYVIEGKGIFNLEGNEIDMEEGVLIYMNADAVHSLKALDNLSFLLILS